MLITDDGIQTYAYGDIIFKEGTLLYWNGITFSKIDPGP